MSHDEKDPVLAAISDEEDDESFVFRTPSKASVKAVPLKGDSPVSSPRQDEQSIEDLTTITANSLCQQQQQPGWAQRKPKPTATTTTTGAGWAQKVAKKDDDETSSTAKKHRKHRRALSDGAAISLSKNGFSRNTGGNHDGPAAPAAQQQSLPQQQQQQQSEDGYKKLERSRSHAAIPRLSLPPLQQGPSSRPTTPTAISSTAKHARSSSSGQALNIANMSRSDRSSPPPFMPQPSVTPRLNGGSAVMRLKQDVLVGRTMHPPDASRVRNTVVNDEEWLSLTGRQQEQQPRTPAPPTTPPSSVGHHRRRSRPAIPLMNGGETMTSQLQRAPSLKREYDTPRVDTAASMVDDEQDLEDDLEFDGNEMLLKKRPSNSRLTPLSRPLPSPSSHRRSSSSAAPVWQDLSVDDGVSPSPSHGSLLTHRRYTDEARLPSPYASSGSLSLTAAGGMVGSFDVEPGDSPPPLSSGHKRPQQQQQQQDGFTASVVGGRLLNLAQSVANTDDDSDVLLQSLSDSPPSPHSISPNGSSQNLSQQQSPAASPPTSVPSTTANQPSSRSQQSSSQSKQQLRQFNSFDTVAKRLGKSASAANVNESKPQQQQQGGVQKRASTGRRASNSADPSSQFNVVRGLGSGGFSVIVLVEHLDSGKLYAMKVISKKSPPKSNPARYRRRLFVESASIRTLPSNPFVQRMYTAFESDTTVFLVGEFLSGGDLLYHLNKEWDRHGRGMKENTVAVVLAEIACGLQHIHSHGIVHRDMKVENVMVDNQGHVKIIDFGMCHYMKEVNGQNKRNVVTPMGSLIYMPPELLRDHVIGYFTDWWALGIIAHELLTGCSPWSSLTDTEELRHQILDVRVNPPPQVSSRAGNLICRLLDHDVRRRLGSQSGISELQEAKLFEGMDWETLKAGKSPPPLSGPPMPINDAESKDILSQYKKGVTQEPEVSGGWMLGLKFTKKRPPINRPRRRKSLPHGSNGSQQVQSTSQRAEEGNSLPSARSDAGRQDHRRASAALDQSDEEGQT